MNFKTHKYETTYLLSELAITSSKYHTKNKHYYWNKLTGGKKCNKMGTKNTFEEINRIFFFFFYISAQNLSGATHYFVIIKLIKFVGEKTKQKH